ncbi:UDP-N-acetylmuramoyl-tripeptide--D-alanyl-D-alanine ligase [Candidatus Nitrospira inopinata]|uniref:UDP-N-acetylmuramoyl-tripeptide--D-alanyl-D-alanine ligase n=1 Tax=Candidatus Nitrospira inopinata TaxID=1715989 RepID=A0A0S4KLG5_9BACT|nr:UDP-N-acetylmuramoyl-tripeptide--D-alanyl-D-alanine ligase [Candidatus Nitrospira inopinata]CUQ65276.1 UDP-N-acetylmuramoyl-tripeptide--D-alanyl-D-alanine ligase [Candidatus Nitrospira inopinata]
MKEKSASEGRKIPMPLFTVEELREVISTKVLSGERLGWLKRPVRRVHLDSRSIRLGDLFVAIRGDRFDGHDFVGEAVSRGAMGAIVHDSFDGASLMKKMGRNGRTPLILGVRDPLFAYQQLAAHHRGRFDVPVVAVTGSNGKTTTKEMVAAVLARRWRVLKTEGNLNNRIGVPRTLFRLDGRHEAAVIEMGVDRVGQTTRLCEIARPTIGIVTNVGPDHLEFFGNMEGSAQAKAELLDLLAENGAAVLNADDPYFEYLASRARCRVVSFGLSPKADVWATDIKPDRRNGTVFNLTLPGKIRHTTVRLHVQGEHNVMNALAAAAVGCELGLSGGLIAKGLSRFRPAAMRSQIVVSRGVTIINDCYNANPASMKAAVRLLAQRGSGRTTIAVLGEMLELGADAASMHEEIGAFVAEQGIHRLVACGALGRHVAAGAERGGLDRSRIVLVSDAVRAGEAVKAVAKSGDVVLVKGSRGMKLERAIEALQGVGSETRKAS